MSNVELLPKACKATKLPRSAWLDWLGVSMYFLAAMLVVLSGLFYAAGQMRSEASVQQCAGTAERFVTTHFTSWWPRFWQQFGGLSSAFDDHLSAPNLRAINAVDLCLLGQRSIIR